MTDERRQHLVRFYSILDTLEHNIGGARKLADCSGRMDWPSRGVYFFRENGEERGDTGKGSRIVRVGTHALTVGVKSKLWTRLSQHRGSSRTGGGNHRSSIFRIRVGAALSARDGDGLPSWGQGPSAKGAVRTSEFALECKVSLYIRSMPFLWIAVDGPGGESERGCIERNSIALLGNYRKPVLDPPSKDWLGRRSDKDEICESGLWNSQHLGEQYDPDFLDKLDELVSKTRRTP
jgi:hypothetical protein